jgi:16S rRNA processing protein RimM
VRLVGPAPRDAEIERSWVHNGRLVLKFVGVNHRNDSEALRGYEVQIPLEARPPAPDGQYYLSDLVGFDVIDLTGRTIGTVTGWFDTGPHAILEVNDNILIPLVPAICLEVNQESKRIVADLPEGLEGLNAG